jgi:hypothetical protein
MQQLDCGVFFAVAGAQITNASVNLARLSELPADF